MSFLGEIKRRKVFQVAAVYAVVAWLLVQIVATVETPLGLPDWVDTLVIILLAVGFPISLIIGWAFNLSPEGSVRELGDEAPVQSHGRTLEITLIGLLLVAVGLLLYRDFSVSPQQGVPTTTVIRFPILAPRNDPASLAAYQTVAISPAGTHVAVIREDAIYVRAMDDTALIPLRGSDGHDVRGVVISPDSRWIVFYSAQIQQLMKVPLAGGSAVAIGDADSYYGGSWTPDGRIIFAQGEDGIFVVHEDGGSPERLVAVDGDVGERAHSPQLLPGGEWVLFTLVHAPKGSQQEQRTSRIVVESLTTGDRRVLIESGTDARYVATGHLVFGELISTASLPGRLLAVSIDIDDPQVDGTPTPVQENLRYQNVNLGADFDVSLDGSLVYRPFIDGSARELVWIDREGLEERVGAPQRAYVYARVSPDGRQIGAAIADEENDVWVWNTESRALRRLSFGPSNENYVLWTPDSLQLIFRSDRDGGTGLFARSVDGTGLAERIIHHTTSLLNPNSISRDGRYLLYREIQTDRNNDLLVFDLETQMTTPVLAAAYNELNGEISPDGHWLAYQSNESGEYEVYLRPFPNVDEGSRWQVSNGGGLHPVWRPDGGEIVYLVPETGLVGRELQGTAAPVFSSVQLITELPTGVAQPNPLSGRFYDISPDGSRFLMVRQAVRTEDPLEGLARYDVVLNWLEELEQQISQP